MFKNMSININQEIWLYMERLYIHCYNAEDFKIFLKKFGIEYDNPLYVQFKNTKVQYTFMSEPNYDFAHFMQTIPTYRYLPILRKIVFDSNITATRRDGWNYYQEYIRGWHPKVMELLRAAGVVIDTQNQNLSTTEDEEDFGGPDFLPYEFNDLFLDYIRKEINESYNNGQLLAVMMLSRKLLEALIIRIAEVALPKMINGKYNQDNHDLWYNKSHNRYHGLETLLVNLKEKSAEFDEDKDLMEQVCDEVDFIRNEANKCVHRDYKIPDESYLKTLKIESTIVSVRKIYKKYCNP
jgi:hypothetical protein